MTDAINGLDRETIADTYRFISRHVRRTPVLDVDAEDFNLPSGRLSFKLEFMQRGGSFKIRGAFAHLLRRQIPEVGVAAASGGNHGVAVAYAAKALNVPATVFVPSIANKAKMEAIRRHGAHLVISGNAYEDALHANHEFVREQGAMTIHAYDQLETMIGQGTVGLEIEEQLPDLDTLFVAVGGGGLIGGIAAWYAGRIKIIAVEPEAAPTLHRALAAGAPVDAEAGGIAQDSLAPRRVGQLMFPVAQRYVSGPILVSDDQIRNAQRRLWEELRVVTEPGGATAFVPLLARLYRPGPEERVGVVLCGGNTNAVEFR